MKNLLARGQARTSLGGWKVVMTKDYNHAILAHVIRTLILLQGAGRMELSTVEMSPDILMAPAC